MVSELTQKYLEIVGEAIYINKGYESDKSDNYNDHVIGLRENLTEFIEKLWKKMSFEFQATVVHADHRPTGAPNYSFNGLTDQLCEYVPIVYGLLENHVGKESELYKLFITLFNLEKVLREWKTN